MRLGDQEMRERLIYLSTRGASVQLHMIFQPQTSPGLTHNTEGLCQPVKAPRYFSKRQGTELDWRGEKRPGLPHKLAARRNVGSPTGKIAFHGNDLQVTIQKERMITR